MHGRVFRPQSPRPQYRSEPDCGKNSEQLRAATRIRVPVFVLPDGAGGVSFGCTEAEYAVPGVAGSLIVTVRGGALPDGTACPRIYRAQMGQKYGAAAVAMINNAAGYPPYEGAIDGVTIPFLGVLASDQTKLMSATAVKSFTAGSVGQSGLRSVVTSFSSGGPRIGDSALEAQHHGRRHFGRLRSHGQRQPKLH